MKEMFPMSISIIDDDMDFLAFLLRYLGARGCNARGFASAEEFLETPHAMKADFYLIDLMLPGLDGIELIGMLRGHSNAGIIVISGRMGPDAFMSALAAGADMFINKPVRFDQIYQAIASVNRRISPTRVMNKHWVYHITSGELHSPTGVVVRLSTTEQRLFATLTSAQGNTVYRAALANSAGIAPSKDDRNLDAAMFRMRRKIEQETQQPAPLKTIHGSGYSALGIDVIPPKLSHE